MPTLARMVLLAAFFCLGTLSAAEDEQVDPLPDEGLADVTINELRGAISEVSNYAPSAAPAAPAAPAKPSADDGAALSLRIGLRQADLRAAIEAQDAKRVEAALEALLTTGDVEPGPRPQRRRARLLELVKEEKWARARSLTNSMIMDRRRAYAGRHGTDQGTLVLCGAWLRFVQLSGSARCAATAERKGPLVRPGMSTKVTERTAQLGAGAKAAPAAQRALEAFARVAPLAQEMGLVTKANACKAKEWAGAGLAGL